MIYHGISHYQFYVALKYIDEDTFPTDIHANELLEHSSRKQDLCDVFFTRICSELAESLPTGFRLELNKRVFSNGVFY